MTRSARFRIEQTAPQWPRIWAVTEWLYWCQEINDTLKRDVNGALFKAAYNAVDWERYYERLKGSPFYSWATEGEGILSFGGPRHIEDDSFFSTIGSLSTWEGDWLEEHPDFNQVLHDVHVEAATQMIDFILERAPQNREKQKRRKRQRRNRRRKRSKTRPESTTFQVGDSVVVRPGTIDPDFDVDIGGWQGRVTEEPSAEGMITIVWDSITLQSTPAAFIEQCEEQGLGWSEYLLEASEVELTTPRDTEEDVARAVEALSRRFAWIWLGEEGERINRILGGIDPDDVMALLRAWEKHLMERLSFPFEAEIFEHQRGGPLRMGDRVSARGISAVDDLYGIVVEVRYQRRRYDLLLCDLRVADASSPNYELVRDYAVWFANR
jgi:hypothetical protein